MISVNKKKIALVEKYNQERLRNRAMKMGVTLKSPETVFLSNDTKYGKNVIINPYVVIGKKTKIGNNVEILSFTFLFKVEPAPTTAPFPIFIGATKAVLEPIKAPSKILVLFFFLPS